MNKKKLLLYLSLLGQLPEKKKTKQKSILLLLALIKIFQIACPQHNS